MNIKFKGHDSGNSRVYGKYNRKLFCIMPADNGFLGIFVCTGDGEPIQQLVETRYSLNGIDKEVIEKIPTRDENRGWGDKVLMELLKIKLRTWN